MGIMDFFRSKQIIIDRNKFSIIIEKIGRELESIREEFVFGAVSGLKSEGANVNGIQRNLEKGSELDSALKAFQLTSVVGFSWNYILLTHQLDFDQRLTNHLDHGDTHRISEYRNRYLDCQGNIDCLSSNLADDVYRIWGNLEPALKYKQALKSAAVPLMIISQATVARVFGDSKTEKNLKESYDLDNNIFELLLMIAFLFKQIPITSRHDRHPPLTGTGIAWYL